MNSVNSLLKLCVVPATLLAMTASPVLAQASGGSYVTAPVPAQSSNGSNSQSGFYLGGSVGVNMLDNTIRSSTAASVDMGIFGVVSSAGNASDSASATGFVGGGFAGYRFDFGNQFNLAVEAFMTGSTAKAGASVNTAFSLDSDLFATSSSNSGVELQYSFGARALPGYQITDTTTAYLILGYANGHFKDTMNGAVQDFSVTPSIVESYSGSRSFNRSGFQVGLGSVVSLTDNLSVRGDVQYTIYSSRTVSGVDSSGASASVKSEINTLEGLVSLVYNFS